MNYEFRIIPNDNLEQIIPLVYELNEFKVSTDLLRSRFDEMKNQNYECAGIFDDNNTIIGVSGMWFCTRHYTGKTVELDHVFIKPEHRNKGLGKKFINWLNQYAMKKGCNSMELNAYVQNYPSHKFYYNEGYEIWGYHFIRMI